LIEIFCRNLLSSGLDFELFFPPPKKNEPEGSLNQGEMMRRPAIFPSEFYCGFGQKWFQWPLESGSRHAVFSPDFSSRSSARLALAWPVGPRPDLFG
jgi:hypothetical protein